MSGKNMSALAERLQNKQRYEAQNIFDVYVPIAYTTVLQLLYCIAMDITKQARNERYYRLDASTDTSDHSGFKDETIELISSEGESFNANKGDLTSCCDYFEALFSSGMKESVLKTVELPTVSTESLDLIVKFINGKNILPLLNAENISNMITDANYLQIPRILDICMSFLRNSLTVTDCYSMVKLGQDLMMPALVQLVQSFIKSHLEEFSQTEDFISLDPEQVIELLSADDVFVSKEMAIFYAAVRWLKTKSSLDKYDVQQIQNIIECVRFGLLTDEERELCMKYAQDLPEVIRETVSDSSCFTKNKNCLHRTKSVWYKPREGSAEAAILMTGGFTRKSECSTNRVQLMPLCELEHNDHDSLRFVISSKLRLPEPLCEHSTCVLDNYLYVAGGQRNYCVDGRSTQNTVWRFDPRMCSWLKVCSMNKPRSLFCLLPLDGSMYAVCGWLKPERVNRSVERYDPETDTWHYVASITIGLHEHAGCSYQGYLYVSGGYKGPARGHLDHLWRYDPTSDTWSQLCPMFQARSYHSMVALETQNKLLVIGGVCSSRELFIDIQNCELYDLDINQWTTLIDVPLPASCMPSLLHDNKVYLFGGHAFQEGNNKHCSLQILDTQNWSWQVIEMDTSGILCAGIGILLFQKNVLDKFLNKTSS